MFKFYSQTLQLQLFIYTCDHSLIILWLYYDVPYTNLILHKPIIGTQSNLNVVV